MSSPIWQIPLGTPPEVVATERERIAQFESASESLARQIVIVAGLIQN